MKSVVCLAVALVVSACASPKYYGSDTASYNGESGKSLRTQLVWSKNKSDSVDLAIRMLNEYPHPIVVKAILLESGGVKVGTTENAQIELQANQSAEKILIFQSTQRNRADTGAKLTMAVQQGSADKAGAALPEVSKSFTMCESGGNTVCE